MRTPSSTLIKILILAPFTGSYVNGSWISSAILAAVETVNNITLASTPFRIKAYVSNTKCDAGNGLADFSQQTQSDPPTVVLGLGCSAVGEALDLLTNELRQPVISTAAISAKLSNRVFWARTSSTVYSRPTTSPDSSTRPNPHPGSFSGGFI